MAAPIITATVDKPAPAVGDVVTLTVNYSDPDAVASTITVTGTDAEGHAATVTTTITVSDPVTLTVADSAARNWVKLSDNGAVAVYKTTI